ncbi:hypothetical protein [Calothrix sp. PCC 6303]|nr:hypothetical protein [Calothrix sp. PCC 6303]
MRSLRDVACPTQVVSRSLCGLLMGLWGYAIAFVNFHQDGVP